MIGHHGHWHFGNYGALPPRVANRKNSKKSFVFAFGGRSIFRGAAVLRLFRHGAICIWRAPFGIVTPQKEGPRSPCGFADRESLEEGRR
jgi:hypothetical protein